MRENDTGFSYIPEKILQKKTKEITIFYTQDNSIGLKSYFGRFILTDSGRVIIPPSFKVEKTIIMVCEGKVKVLNSYGDRLGVYHEPECENLTISNTHPPSFNMY